ncbi:MAG: ATP-binding protein involved in chromosome partitioning [Chloroflexi bacterium]|jgi:ATP-binding protein involved in chromosome partitioning|nr:MAG: ATP-binding protein involved in chromosome partitioning [Chloroflexota bacterium]
MTQKPGNPAQNAQARAKIESMKRQFEQRRAISSALSSVKYKIGVYSGKGGVGKTTVSVNLAVTLAEMGKKVGILDVDIDCPNVVRAMKIFEPPEMAEDKRLIPPSRFGVSVMSMGFFQQKEDEAIIWRGPMVHNAINQLLQSTVWGELDFLIVDLPPGTSDGPLTVMQTLNLDGFVVVTAPQELAKIDAKRSINMIKTLKVDVLGVVENFSGEIFGTGAGEEICNELELSFLGKLELSSDYRDESKPTVLTSNNVRDEYRSVVSQLEIELKKKQDS